MNLFIADIQMKLDQEKSARVSAENQLLQAEKEKSELRVDLLQMTQQVTSVQTELMNEKEKVVKNFKVNLSKETRELFSLKQLSHD